MAEAIDGDDADGHVYSVRPEPPRFEELVRRPALYSNDSPFKPPGPILRWFGSQRLRVLFRAGIVAAVGVIVVAILR